MSVWERNGIWYYQFRYRNKQYSGRAGDAKTELEARHAEQARRRRILHEDNGQQGVYDHPITLQRTAEEFKMTLVFKKSVLTELLEQGTTELTLKMP